MDEHILESIAGYCAGEMDEDEASRLKEWLDEDPANRKILEDYLHTFRLHAVAGKTFPYDRIRSWAALEAGLHRSVRRRLFRRMLPLVAVLVIGLAVTSVWMLQHSRSSAGSAAEIVPGTTKATLVMADGSELDLGCGQIRQVVEAKTLIRNDSVHGLQYDSQQNASQKPLFHTVKVPVTGEYHFVLPDGTKVWLNSDSEISFPLHFSGLERVVHVKGEVYFEVARNVDMPFVVHVGKVDVRVLGTRFNVNAYAESGQVATTLLQGAVAVRCGGREERLVPGTQALTDLQSGRTVLKKVDAEMYLSWVNGIFEYEDMPLGEIARQLSRWYDVDFVFVDPEFTNRHFTGAVRRYEVLGRALEIIEKTTDVRFIVSGRTVAVESNDHF